MTDPIVDLAVLNPAEAVMVAATLGNFSVISDPVYRQCIAAALRAAADQVVPLNICGTNSTRAQTLRAATRHKLLAIAAELEAQ